MGLVVAVLVGQDPGHVCFGGGVDEFGLLVRGRAGVHCDDEGVDAAEGSDEGRGVVVVDSFDGGAGGDVVGAGGAGEGGDFVLSGLEERFGDVFADSAAGLVRRVGFRLCERKGGWRAEELRKSNSPRRQRHFLYSS